MRIRRGALRDVYVEDGRSAVFVNEQVIVLSEIATVILQATPPDRSITLEHLTNEVVAEVGPPAPPLDAGTLVTQQVHDLVAHSVLNTDEPIGDDALTPQAVQALRDALRHVLSSSTSTWAPDAAVTGDALLAASRRHRVTPTLAASLDRLDLPPSTAARIAAAAAQERATVTQLAADLSRAIGLLADAGIRCLTFKGLALASQAHGNAAARGTGDLDLLVHPDDLTRAHHALTTGGWAPAVGYPAPGASWAWRHYVRTGHELSLASSTSLVDLHWHLSPARSAFPDFDTLWARAVEVDVLGRTVRTLAPYDALAHSASHSAKDGWGWLRGIVDVHRLMSVPDTWRAADRPLGHDQLLTVGLAARMFGAPDTAPDVVHVSSGLAADVWDAALARQASGGASHEATRVPGFALVRGFRTLRWSGAGRQDLWRHASHSAMPEWLTAEETSPHALVAVPRVLARRTSALYRRARQIRRARPTE